MEIKYDERHGSPFDRGMADSFYRRKYAPHHTFTGQTVTELTESEIEVYRAGFVSVDDMDKKVWE